MGQTVVEKIIAHNIGRDSVKAGEIVTVQVDRVMMDDIMVPFIVDKFKEMGFQKVWDPDKAVLIYDHFLPASQVDDTRHFRIGDAFAREQGLTRIHRTDGICHQLMTEAGHVKPGNVVFWNRQPHHDLWMCGRIFYRYRLYRDGGDSGNGNLVGESAGDHSY